jgi:hypothetical protein
MGRSQGKQKVSRRTATVRNIDLVRSMLLEDKGYRLRGSTVGMQIFQTPEDLIDLINSGDFEKFWQEASSQEIPVVATSGQGLKVLYKDPVFRAFYEGGIRAAERERKSFDNDYYHWISRMDLEDSTNEALFKEDFAREFLTSLSSPDTAPHGLEGWIFSGKSSVDEYNTSLYFREKYKNLISSNPKNYPDLIAKDLDPLTSKYKDGYVANDVMLALSTQVANLVITKKDSGDPFLPGEIHNHLNGLLGTNKLGGEGWVSMSAPWREHGVSHLTRDSILNAWQKEGLFPSDQIDSFVEQGYSLSLETQLATVISRDYRERTRSQNPEEKLRGAINKVKNKKTMFRRLKPIFESEGQADVFNKMIKLDKLETFNSTDLANLLKSISTEYIRECNKNTPPSPDNTSLSKIINDKINSF